MVTRPFHIGDVLSVTTGKLVAPSGIGAVYEILNFMSGDNLYTHQLPRVSDEARPYLLKQFPQLAHETGNEVTPQNFRVWLREAEAIYGEYLLVEPMPQDAHERIDPLSELAEKVHPDKIIVVPVKTESEG